MIRIRQGKVVKIVSQKPGITEVQVQLGDILDKAVNYDYLTGPIEIGNQVVLNTTAIHLGLGTGGVHFVMANLDNPQLNPAEEGHIMKLRYTPMQVKCLAVEEEDSPHAQQIRKFQDLKKTPVIIGSLHSQIAPAAVGIKVAGKEKLKVAYIMTDGAALPLAFSKLTAELKAKDLIQATITVGNAFGGDYEAVNIYSGLITAKEVVGADVIIVAMGPGIVGTGSQWGFSGVEQGEIINAVNILGGKAIAIPRISFADSRKRHQGISHHSLTVLEQIALTPATLPFPLMDPIKTKLVRDQIRSHGLTNRHQIVIEDGEPALLAMENIFQLKVTTMGRNTLEDREFFLAAAAAGIVAAKLIVY